MSDPISLPGASVVAWVLNEPAARHPLLVGLEWADDDDEWIIAASAQGALALTAAHGATTRRIRFTELEYGEIYAPADSAFAREWLRTRSVFERKLAAAHEHFRRRGLPAGESLPPAAAVRLHELLAAMPPDPAVPGGAAREALHDVVRASDDTELLRWAARTFEGWHERLSADAPYDGEATLRIQIAGLARRAGLPELALRATDAVQRDRGDFERTDAQDAVLCVERAAALLDGLEKRPGGPPDDEAFGHAEALLKSAWRHNPGAGDIQAVYRRFHALRRSAAA
jgi:hypothetical protein